VAIKIIPKEHFTGDDDFSGIYSKVLECKSPFTPTVYGIGEKQNAFWIITQFIDGGSVFDLVFFPFSLFYVHTSSSFLPTLLFHTSKCCLLNFAVKARPFGRDTHCYHFTWSVESVKVCS
jgi:hypothetical protein